MPKGSKGEKRKADLIGLRVTPAMEAGLTDKLGSWEEILEAMDATTPAQKRGPYNKLPAPNSN